MTPVPNGWFRIARRHPSRDRRSDLCGLRAFEKRCSGGVIANELKVADSPENEVTQNGASGKNKGVSRESCCHRSGIERVAGVRSECGRRSGVREEAPDQGALGSDAVMVLEQSGVGDVVGSLQGRRRGEGGGPRSEGGEGDRVRVVATQRQQPVPQHIEQVLLVIDSLNVQVLASNRQMRQLVRASELCRRADDRAGCGTGDSSRSSPRSTTCLDSSTRTDCSRTWD